MLKYLYFFFYLKLQPSSLKFIIPVITPLSYPFKAYSVFTWHSHCTEKEICAEEMTIHSTEAEVLK